MNRFTYKARNKEGKIIEGEVEAQTSSAAAKLIKNKGYVVISIRPKRQGIVNWINSFRSRIGTREVANFTRQFATMINAGLPVTDSLSILRLQAQDKFQLIVGKILDDVESGESLSTAFSKYPNVFSPTYVALIKAGETGGVLDKVLIRVADNLEKSEDFKGKVRAALVYPAIVVIGMIAVAFIMIVFVIPKLLGLYSQFNATLPLPTQILITTSNIFIRFWPFVLVILIIGFLFLSSYAKTKEGRYRLDELMFKIPVFGELQRKVMLTDLARTLSLMVGAGVPIIEGMQVTANAMGSVVVRDALLDASNQVEKGFPIAFSFAKHPEAFPYIFSQMAAVGEESGKIDEVLSRLAQVFENESDQSVKALTSAIEPIVMLVLGLGVGFLAIAVIMPIYNLTSQF